VKFLARLLVVPVVSEDASFAINRIWPVRIRKSARQHDKFKRPERATISKAAHQTHFQQRIQRIVARVTGSFTLVCRVDQ
jgi:hypothetical protein